jgi:hypothetical protein
MNITPTRPTLLAPLSWLPPGLPCVHHQWRHRDHTRTAPRTSLTGGENVTGSRPGWTSNGDLGLRVRLAWLKSP